MTKTQMNIRASDLTHAQIKELGEKLNMNQAELIAISVDRMYRNQSAVLSDETIDIINNCPRGHTTAEHEKRQELLAKVGRMAIPDRGHSCPMCNRSGTLYCLDTLVSRMRGFR